ELGIADVMFGPANYLESSLAWADAVLGGKKVDRPHTPGTLERTVKWPIALKIARDTLEKKLGTVPLAPYRALDIIELAKKNDRKAGFAAEDAALAELIPGDQFAASIYAFDLVQKRAKRPAGAPDKALAKPVSKVG